MTAQPQSPKKLKTLDDVDEALHELSWIDHQLQKLKASAQQEIDALKLRQADRFICQIDGEMMPMVKRRDAVELLVRAWCDAHLAGHLVDDKKSRDLPHGVVGFRQSPLKVELGDGVTEAAVLDKLDHKTDFRQWAVDLLAKLLGKHVLGIFLAVDFKLSFAKMLSALKERRIDEKALTGLGLVVRPPADQVVIKPATYVVDASAARD